MPKETFARSRSEKPSFDETQAARQDYQSPPVISLYVPGVSETFAGGLARGVGSVGELSVQQHKKEADAIKKAALLRSEIAVDESLGNLERKYLMDPVGFGTAAAEAKLEWINAVPSNVAREASLLFDSKVASVTQKINDRVHKRSLDETKATLLEGLERHRIAALSAIRSGRPDAAAMSIGAFESARESLVDSAMISASEAVRLKTSFAQSMIVEDHVGRFDLALSEGIGSARSALASFKSNIPEGLDPSKYDELTRYMEARVRSRLVDIRRAAAESRRIVGEQRRETMNLRLVAAANGEYGYDDLEKDISEGVVVRGTDEWRRVHTALDIKTRDDIKTAKALQEEIKRNLYEDRAEAGLFDEEDLESAVATGDVTYGDDTWKSVKDKIENTDEATREAKAKELASKEKDSLESFVNVAEDQAEAGGVSFEDLDTYVEDGKISYGSNEWKRVKDAIDKRIKDEKKTSDGIARVQSALNGATILDPKEDKKAVDAYYEANIAPKMKNSIEDIGVVTGYIKDTGVVPTKVRGTIVGGLRSQNPEIKSYASELFMAIEAVAPEAAGDIPDTVAKQARITSALTSAGTPPDEAAKAATETLYAPDSVKDRRKAHLTKKHLDEIGGEFQTQIAEDMDVPELTDPAIIDVLVTDFQRAYENAYLDLGDEDLAKQHAYSQIKRVWGPQRSDSRERISRHPPEFSYGVFKDPELDAAWIKEQALHEVRERYPDESVTGNTLILRVNPDSLRGGAPTYFVEKLVNGVLEPVGDGQMDWRPEWSTSPEKLRLDAMSEEEKLEQQRKRSEVLREREAMRERVSKIRKQGHGIRGAASQLERE